MGIAVPLQEDIEAGFRAARVRSIAPLGPVGIRCAALSLILLTLAQAAAADLTMHRKLAGTPDPYGWYLAESTRGAFSVMLPVPFNDFTATTTATDEPVLRSEIVGSTSAEGIKFLASRHYYREVGAAENYFNAFATGSKGAAPRRFAFQQHKAIGGDLSWEYGGSPESDLGW